MTTAHRPTWTAAREHGNEFGVYSSGGVRSAMAHARDVPNQLKMKYRTGHQLEGIADATPEDYAARLDAAERSSGAPQGQLLLAADARVARAPDQLRDVAVAPGALDAYDDRDASDGEGSDSDSDSDSDDDGAALRAALEKGADPRGAGRGAAARGGRGRGGQGRRRDEPAPRPGAARRAISRRLWTYC